MRIRLSTIAPLSMVVALVAWTQSSDIEAINRLFVEFQSAVNAGDLDSFLACYTDDAVEVPPNRPVLTGKAAIRANSEPVWELTSYDLTINVEKLVVPGDWAFALCTVTGTRTPKAGGATVQVNAKELFVLQRQDDGFWKIALDAFPR